MLQSVVLASGQVLLKLGLPAATGSQHSGLRDWESWKGLLTNWWLAGSGICFGVGGVLWLWIVKHFPLSVAYPMVSLSYVFGMLAAVLVFDEEVSVIRWIGVACIIIGCYLIAR